MSGVERVEYMDNQKSGMMTEAIQKERKIQRQYFKQQEAAGLIKPAGPPAAQHYDSLVDTVQMPDHMRTLQEDPIMNMNSTISKSLWSQSNPGYIVRDGQHMASSFKKEFVYDQEEVDYMRSLGYLDKTHNRRRDEFTRYVEAAARSKALSKGSQ
mmetsp:Transcript_4512/g.7632  ORF Transcript_4512/g.7632 Transcript_4512/m.7632 type:complete len:155 (+) Transcript_4512:178-642(+)